MSAFYRFTASVPLKTPKTGGQEQAVRALERLLDQCEDVSMEELEDPDGGGAWLEIQCPEQSMNYSFIRCLDQAVANLGPFAAEAFTLEYQYEGEAAGVEFHGPTAESIQEARRQWHQAKAAECLKQAGLDLDALLQAQAFSRQVASLTIWGGPGVENDDSLFGPRVGTDDSRRRLADLVGQARKIAETGIGLPAF